MLGYQQNTNETSSTCWTNITNRVDMWNKTQSSKQFIIVSNSNFQTKSINNREAWQGGIVISQCLNLCLTWKPVNIMIHQPDRRFTHLLCCQQAKLDYGSTACSNQGRCPLLVYENLPLEKHFYLLIEVFVVKPMNRCNPDLRTCSLTLL